MKNLIILISFAYIPHLTVGQETSQSLLLRLQSKITNTNLYSFNSKYRIKYFDNKDTTEFTSYFCTIARVPSDTILGYYASIKNINEQRIYDGINFYLIWHKDKRIIKDIPSVTGKRFTNANINKSQIPAILISNTAFRTYLDAESKLSEVFINGIDCWRIEIALPTDAEITSLTRVIYLEKKSLNPVRIEGFAKYQNIQDEFWEIQLEHFSAQSIPKIDFLEYYEYPEGYKEEIYITPNVDLSLLETGSDFIPFSGVDSETNKTTIGSGNGLLLLDFWYLACAPCIRSMPYLEKLQRKYKNSISIVGVNPIDNPTEKQMDIQKFMARLELSYPFVFVSKSVQDDYQVRIFPTVYLIKDNKVIYSHVGFTEKSFDELEAALHKAIQIKK